MSATTTKPQELAVIVKGEIVTSNFTSFQKFVKDQLSYINYTPETDIEFGNAEQDVKMLKTVEKSITDAKAQALTQMESVNELFTNLDSMGEDMRQNRLKLEKAIKTKKAEVRKEILDDAYDSIIATNKGVEHRSELEKAIKGKRNIDSIRAAAESYVESINESVLACRNVLNEHSHQHGNTLIPDSSTLELGDPSHLRTELELRVEKSRAEEERKKREKEEANRKAEEEAERKAAAEKEEALRKTLDTVNSGHAGVNEKGTIVDRREHPNSTPMAENSHLGVPAPKEDSASEATNSYDELITFAQTVKSAFMPVKSARCKLTTDEAVRISQEFADEAGRAFQKLQSSIHELRMGGVA